MVGRRPPSDLPPLSFGDAGFQIWMIAMMAFIATVAIFAGGAMTALAERWERGLSGSMTVELPPVDGVPQADDGVDVADVVALLRDWPGVGSARVIDDRQLVELLDPWLGQSLPVAELPLPRLIDVTVADRASLDRQRLAAELDRKVPGAVLNDHEAWLVELARLAYAIRSGTWALLGLVLVTAGIVIVAACRARLAIDTQQVEILHLMGATDRYIARQFQDRAFQLAFRGGLIGTLVAVIGVALFWSMMTGSATALIPEVRLTWAVWAGVVLMPLATALLALIVARLTVMRALRRML